MKKLLTVCLLAVLTLHFTSCSTPEERQRRDAERAREDAQYDAEQRQRDRQDFDEYLADYAHSLGKSVGQLTPSERADARREYGDGDYSRGHSRWHYWY